MTAPRFLLDLIARNPLRARAHQNSLYLFLSVVALSFLGALFWFVAAHMCASSEVGIAVGVIALLNVITSVGLLGFDSAVIRYLPQSTSPDRLLSTLLTISAIAAALLAGVGVLVQPLVSSKLGVVHSDAPALVGFVGYSVAWTVVFMLTSVFTAVRVAHYVLLMNLVIGVMRLPVLLAFSSLGATGIVGSWTVALALGSVAGLAFLRLRTPYRVRIAARLEPLRGLIGFSLANWVGSFAEGADVLLLPLVVLALYGTSAAAYYYVAMMIATVLYNVAVAAGQSLFAEGAHDYGRLRSSVRSATSFIAVLTVPGILVVCALAPWVLDRFGGAYGQHGAGLLRILALSAIPFAANAIFRTIVKLRYQNAAVVTIGIIGSVVSVALCYPLRSLGLDGVGLAWLAGQLVTLAGFVWAIRDLILRRSPSGLSVDVTGDQLPARATADSG
ncbi:MAG: lipopolysaccharide biosynthesis protein [Solirubrobacteraceae bacterium]